MSGTLNSGRPGGNPDFGTKYKIHAKGEEPLTEKISVRLPASIKKFLESLGKDYPEFVREAIAEKMERTVAAKTKTVTAEPEQVGQQPQHNQTNRKDQEQETSPNLEAQEATPKKQRKAGQTQGQKQGKPRSQTRSRKNSATQKTTEQDQPDKD
jgi:hypothetical protein